MDRNEERTLFALYIGALLRKHADGLPLEDQEKKDLEDWCNSSQERRQIFLNAADKKAVEAELRRLNAKYEANEAVGRIFASLELEHNAVQQPGVFTAGRGYTRWFVAAAVTGALMYGVYMMATLRHKGVPSAPSSSSVTKSDISPGRNTAVLTLSGGRQILLDSAREGLLALQGNTQIDHSNGRIAYRSLSNTAAFAYNILSTPKGGQYHLLLPDGSKVWLNAASSIRFPTTFTGSVRSVEVRGEAYFEVAHVTAGKSSNKVPFIVSILKSGGEKAGEVEVLGTHFNINAYDDEDAIKTTLLEGKVRVAEEAGSQKSENSVVLKPGEQAVMAATRLPLTTHHSALTIDHSPNLEQIMAWKNGLFIFDHSDIQTVMRQLARWYNMEVEYRGRPTTDLFGGDIQRNLPLSKVFRILEKSQVHFSIEEGKIIVMP